MPAKSTKRGPGRPPGTGDGLTAAVHGFYVWPEVAEALDYLVKDTGLSRAYWVRTALLEHLVGKGLVLPRPSRRTKTNG
jgi:hypothetical protein